MLERLRAMLGASAGGAEPPPADHLTLCAAVLMVYAAQLDGRLDEAERQVVAALLQKRFALAPAAAAALVEDADRRARETTDLYSLTRDIKDGLELAERIGVIEMLWQVVYADGMVNAYESNLVRRVAGLLYVSDVESGAARKRVADRLGI
jgi:uncharacterized tellurite resistance protein B-like protein